MPLSILPPGNNNLKTATKLQTMLQPNELRVGNYVYFPPHNKFYAIVEKIGLRDIQLHSEKGKEGVCLCDSNISLFMSFLEPIPLTAEILLKCGFENNIDNLWVKGLMGIFLEKSSLIIYQDKAKRIVKFPSFYRKYLHQLQNIYFDCTGEELDVKL